MKLFFMFSPRNFTVSGFTFKFNWFWVDFFLCVCFQIKVQFYSFAYGCLFSPSLFVKETIFSSLAFFFSKINWPNMCRFISGLSILLYLLYLSVFIAVPYYFNDCDFVMFWDQKVWCLQLQQNIGNQNKKRHMGPHQATKGFCTAKETTEKNDNL